MSNDLFVREVPISIVRLGLVRHRQLLGRLARRRNARILLGLPILKGGVAHDAPGRAILLNDCLTGGIYRALLLKSD